MTVLTKMNPVGGFRDERDKIRRYLYIVCKHIERVDGSTDIAVIGIDFTRDKALAIVASNTGSWLNRVMITDACSFNGTPTQRKPRLVEDVKDYAPLKIDEPVLP